MRTVLTHTDEFPSLGTQFIQGRYQKGELILSGNGEEVYEPRFSYFGFRYVQVEGLIAAPDDGTLEGRWVHSDMPQTGQFLCSDDRLNHLQEVIVRSNKNYIHHFPRDPAREKRVWTQDAQTCMAMGLMNMEMANIYRNWYTHILDQQQPNGHVRPIGPSSGWGQSYGADATPGICSDPWWGGGGGARAKKYASTLGHKGSKRFRTRIQTAYVS